MRLDRCTSTPSRVETLIRSSRPSTRTCVPARSGVKHLSSPMACVVSILSDKPRPSCVTRCSGCVLSLRSTRSRSLSLPRLPHPRYSSRVVESLCESSISAMSTSTGSTQCVANRAGGVDRSLWQVGADANCTKPLCCRNFADQAGKPITEPAGPSGNANCDSPVKLADAMLSAVKDLDPNFAIFTGDVVEGSSLVLPLAYVPTW